MKGVLVVAQRENHVQADWTGAFFMLCKTLTYLPWADGLSQCFVMLYHPDVSPLRRSAEPALCHAVRVMHAAIPASPGVHAADARGQEPRQPGCHKRQ